MEASARQWLDTLSQSRTAAGFQAYMDAAQRQAALEGPSFAERLRDFVIQEFPVIVLTSILSGGTAGIATAIFRLGWRGQLLVDLIAAMPIELAIQNLQGQSANITVESAMGTLAFTTVGFGVFRGLGAIVRTIRPSAPQISPQIRNLIDRPYVLRMMSVGAWRRPRGWHLPRNGTWSNIPGHSDFIPNNPLELGIPAGSRISFHNGYPDFSPWQRGNPLNVPGMNGIHTHDMPMIHREVARLNGWLKADGTPNAAAGRRWLDEQGLIPHHAGGNSVQLIPAPLHEGVRHMGGAWELRNY